MRFLPLLLALALPVSAWAQTRTLTVSAPSQVYAGQSITVPTSASTNAGGGEQIGFYHGQYSTDGGASWTWFTSDVNVGTSVTRNAYVTAGAAGSTIVVRVRSAFRGGAAGDVDYDGNAIDWGGSWDGFGSPPARYGYISVVAPPNQAPTIAWTQAPAAGWINEWFAVQARGNDGDGNLSSVSVWKEWVPFAFNGGGNGWESYSDANMASSSVATGIAFQAQSGDSAGATSAFISHTVPIYNRAPSGTFTVNGSAGNSSITFGQSVAVSSSVSDPDGNISVHSFWWDQGSGLYWTHPFITWTYAPNSAGWFNLNLGANGYNASGYSSTRGFDFRPTKAATFAIHNVVADPYQWISVGASIIYLTVNKATPTGTFANRTLAPGGPTYTVQSADLNATFSHPFSGAVVGPTGSVTYSLVAGGSGSVTTGTQLAAGSTYTVRASYAGDANYHPTFVDAVWTIGPEPTYTLTVENGTGGASGLTIGTARSITANAPQSGQVFIDWTVVAGPGTIANASATSTTFTMGAGNATVRANYADFLPNGDDDGDGMTNQWEVDNELDRNDASDALDDIDVDGLTNIAEYNLGTNPRQYNVGTSAQGNSLPAGWDLQLKAVNGRGESVGGTSGEFSVDKSGAATYSIPIWVSPGTAGMEPKITLNYSSQAGYGIAGHGWSIGGLSSITRGPKTLASDDTIHGVNLSRDDQYYMDGQRLKHVGGNSHSYAGAEYRTELDSFTRVVAQSSAGEGPESFKAWTKSGLIIEFGGTASSRLKSNAPNKTEIINWAVSRISDTSGNYMDFIYANDEPSGEQRIVRIEYTGHTGSPVITPYAALEFEYEARGDTRVSYVAGSKISVTQRLKRIKATQGGGVLRTYTLNYLVRAQTNRSLLGELIESGTHGGALPSLVFEYEEQTGGWSGSSLTPPLPLAISSTSQAGTGFIDLNGDGKPDFIAKKYGSTGQVVHNEVWINTGSSWETNTTLSNSYRLPDPVSLAWEGRMDTGNRFVDLDGDGLVDAIFAYKEGDGSVSRYAYRNTGSGWEPRWDWNLPSDTYLGQLPPGSETAVTYSQADRGRRFLDVNGDGLPDLVWNASFRRLTGSNLVWVTETGCYLNNTDGKIQSGGPAWVSSSVWTPKLDITAGAIFMDVNGDGLPDQVLHNYGENKTRIGVVLNSPSGWQALNYEEYNGTPQPHTYATKFGGLGRFIPPADLNYWVSTDRKKPAGSEVVDLNGDGLADIVYSNLYYNFRASYLNTGNGWVDAPQWQVPSGLWFATSTHDSTGSAIIDLNGDGLPDLVRRTESGISEYNLGTGNGWGALNTHGGSGNLGLPYHLVRNTPSNPAGADLVDLNGDGVIDMVWNLSGGDSGAQINGARQRDLLTRVTNSFGVPVSIEYKPLSDPSVYTKGTGAAFPVADVIGPMYVVSKVKHGQMYGGGTDDQTYGYGKLRSHAEYGSLGFEWTTVHDHRTNFRTTTTYRQDYPFIGMAVDTYTKKENGSGHTLSESSVLYDVKWLHGGATRFVFAKETTQYSYDLLNGAYTVGYNRTITQRGGMGDTSDYDDYGNSKYQEVHTSPYSRTETASTYDNTVTADKWHLGRLTRSTVTHIGNGLTSIVRVSAFEYDTNTGLLKKEIVEPDLAASPDNLTLTTTYQHDAFGNRTSVSVAGGGLPTRTTTTTYDPAAIGSPGINGRFPVRLTNAKGHSETYGYHQGFGVPSSQTGPNGLTTSWQFDNLGRKSREDRPDGTHTIWTYNWAHESTSPGGQYYIETRSSGAPPTIVFYNNWGKQTTSYTLNGGLNDGNARIVGVTTGYDGWGRPTSTSLPFYYGSTVRAATVTTYDLLDRPVTVQSLHESSNGTWLTTTMAYEGLVTRVTNPKGQQTETTKNLEGQVTRVVNNALAAEGAADRGRVEYVYDATGNLKETRVFKDASNYVATVLNYDVRGRKTSMVDPDMGTWSYTYNAAGELKTQTDANNNTIVLDYDDLGRLKSRIEPEGTTTWTYDTSPKGASTWKGKLHTVTGPTDRGKTYSEAHTYDDLGRPMTTLRTIDGVSYGISQAYDAFSRPTVTTYPYGFKTENRYNAFGFLKEVREGGGTLSTFLGDVVPGHVFWQADRYALSGEVDGGRFGNGLTYDRVINDLTGRVQAIATGIATANQVQSHHYTYDEVGNVTDRIDITTGRHDKFEEYDGLNRLKKHEVVNGATVTVQYNALGNITHKSDVGSYTYHAQKVHAVTAAGGNTYTYDPNGNMLTGGGRTLQWTSFNQLRKVTQAGQNTEFWFGANRERVYQQHSNGTKTTYVGTHYEMVVLPGGDLEHKYYVLTPMGRSAVRTVRTNGSAYTRYLHQDALGSIVAVTDEFGKVEKRYTFDAWGKRVQTVNTHSGPGNILTRGYTDHEHLEDFGLIHMNGRVYDPVLARFLSADPFVGDVSDSESYNRYSYVNNNPVNAIDPSGYFLKKLFKVVAAVVISVVTYGAASGWAAGWLAANTAWSASTIAFGATVAGGTAAGFASGFASSLLNGGSIGDAFKAGAIGGLIGGVTAGIVHKLGAAAGGTERSLREIVEAGPRYASRDDIAIHLFSRGRAFHTAQAARGIMAEAGLAALQGGRAYLMGLGQGVWGAVKGTAHAIAHPIQTVQGIADGLGTLAGRAVYDRAALGSDLWNGVVSTLTDPASLGNAVGHVVGGAGLGGGASALRAMSRSLTVVETAAAPRAYSVAYRTRLAPESYPGVSRGAHFQEANGNLLRAMEGDASFARSMRDLGVNLERTPTGLAPRQSPAGWTWHHADSLGELQLVPRFQHAPGSAWQELLHPSGHGGYSIWGK